MFAYDPMTTNVQFSNARLAAGVDYLAHGWSALWLCPPEPADHAKVDPRHRAHCSKPGKQPLGRWKDCQQRRLRQDQLEQWACQCPAGNIGIVLGRVSGLIGLDIDGPDAEQLLQEISGGDLPPTLEFRTPSGGRRLLYRLPVGAVVRRRRFDRGTSHVIVLGEGSQTVMPPSRLPHGEYLWEIEQRPGEIEPAICPSWLRTTSPRGLPGGRTNRTQLPPDLERRQKRARAYLETIAGSIQGQNGSRWLRKAACKLVGKFQLPRDVALDLLRADFNPRCRPPWSEWELSHAVDYALTTHQETPVNDNLPELSSTEKEHAPMSNHQAPQNKTSNPGGASTTGSQPKPVLLTCDSELESRPVTYLARKLPIALGMLTLLYGLRDCNKSTLALLLAVWLSRKGKHVIFLSAEENWQEFLLPKLRGLGADFNFLEVLTGTVQTVNGEECFDLSPECLALLRDRVREKKTQLVVFDPLFSVLPDRLQADRAPHVRKLLFHLKRFTESEGVAILGIAHVNKDTSQDPRNRLSGSAAWTDAPRSVYLMTRDPDDPLSPRRYLVSNKANPFKDEEKVVTLWEVKSISMLCKNGSKLLDNDGKPLTAPTLQFVGVTSETFESLTDPDRQQKKEMHEAQEGRKRQMAKIFLRGVLAWGPRPAPEIKALAADVGIAEGTLVRAKDDLGIHSEPPTKENGKHWFWSLPPGEVEAN
jgi:hypothetical protein